MRTIQNDTHLPPRMILAIIHGSESHVVTGQHLCKSASFARESELLAANYLFSPQINADIKKAENFSAFVYCNVVVTFNIRLCVIA